MARPVAGVRKNTVIVTVPGSPKGARENLGAIVEFLPHACRQAAGMNSRAMHVGGVQRLESEAGISRGGMSNWHKKEFCHKNLIGMVPDADNHSHHKNHSHTLHHHSHAIPHAHTRPEDRPLSNDPAAGPSRRHRQSPYPMQSVGQALELIKQHSPRPSVIKKPVNIHLVGHVLAEDVTARESVPAFRASIVDGYAVRIPSSGKLPKGAYPVSIISHAQAGVVPELMDGQVARITTGAPLPPGSSAVIMVEDTVLKSMTDDGKEEKEVEILTSAVTEGENVREIGSDVQKGDTVLRKGAAISAIGGEFGLIASVGVQEVSVYRKPIVGILSTGDELVSHTSTSPLTSGEVRDTNRPTLLTAVKSTGFEAVDLGIASDQ
jgi:gephyrin